MNWRLLTLAVVVAIALTALATGCGGSKATIHRLTPGQRVDFKPGALAVGSRVGCIKSVYRVVVRVPSRGHIVTGDSDNGPHATEIRLRTRRDGSVLSCLLATVSPGSLGVWTLAWASVPE